MSVQPYVRSVFQDLNESFSLGLCDVSFEKVVTRRIQNKNTLPNEYLEFLLPQTSPPLVYLLKDTIFDFQVLITKKDRVPLTSMPQITVCNNLMHSLFSSLEMKIQNTTIGADYNYMYKAYIVNLLSYDNLIKNTQLRTEGWYSGKFYHQSNDNLISVRPQKPI